MLSFNRVFGGGAPLRQRPIWTGSERLLPGVVVSQIRPFKMRPKTSPVQLIERIAYSGSIYAVLYGGSLFTGASLQALIGRSISGATGFYSFQAFGGELFLCAFFSSSSYPTVYRSTDGVTWSSVGGGASSDDALHVAGGKLYLVGRASQSFYEYDPATKALVNRAFPEWNGGPWGGILHNGSVWLAYSAYGGYSYRAVVSEDGVTFAAASAAFNTAASLMPIAANYVYVLGSKFIAVGSSSQFGHIATMESANGRDWTLTGTCQVTSTTRGIQQLSRRSIVIDGVLYVGAVLNDNGKFVATLLSTTDGIAWRAHADAEVFTADRANIEIFRKPGSNGLILCCTNVETDVDNGVELYYEL